MFTVLADDVAITLGPELLARVRAEAPGVSLCFLGQDATSEGVAQPRDRRADLDIGVIEDAHRRSSSSPCSPTGWPRQERGTARRRQRHPGRPQGEYDFPPDQAARAAHSHGLPRSIGSAGERMLRLVVAAEIRGGMTTTSYVRPRPTAGT
ncbi:hypothetical protein [Actinoplanes teichomyceticus]|uniref:hypothetical protein n=1 Tax=Actinoplanes teichomyceticus TaxID=1867 RepID=UPI0011AA3A5D|nr:hypothetical protein [Actinoplanes teichomyceticus]